MSYLSKHCGTCLLHAMFVRKFLDFGHKYSGILLQLKTQQTVLLFFACRPYSGEFVAADPQRRLDLPKPRFPNGDSPPGFLGYAVNMINIDTAHLYFLTASGYGLRETLFYSLFSCLQIYKTRAEMLQAVPCITDGALSLDGGIIKRSGLFYLGNRYESLLCNLNDCIDYESESLLWSLSQHLGILCR